MGESLVIRREEVKTVVTVVAASLLIVLGAQVQVRLPFSPVPVTLQTFAVLLAGALLGSRRGALAVLAYLAQGLMGLPVFAGWRGGVAHLLGPTGGYLLGFVAAAFVTGVLFERGWGAKPISAFLALLAGNAVIYALGLPWLALYVGAGRAVALGLAPFVIGDAAKIVCAAALLYSSNTKRNS